LKLSYSADRVECIVNQRCIPPDITGHLLGA
jgi:hypothetical protein